jgi:hypothetical protein
MTEITHGAVAEVIGNAATALKSGNFPNHDVFTISEILGASLGLPKEMVIEQLGKEMMK